MTYDFDRVIERRNTDSEKWNRYPRDTIPLWVADMDFPSPEPVRRALSDRVAHGVFGYPKEPAGLRELIVARLADRYRWAVQPDELVFQPGVIRGFNRACALFADEKGAGVLIQTPVYPPFFRAPASSGLELQELELTRGDDASYSIDMDALQASLTPRTRLFLLCNPHNPVGRVFRRDELARMAELCLSRRVVICSDEIHCDLAFPGHDHTPIATLDPEVAARTITLMAPSKTFNIAGLDLSFAVVQNPDLRLRYERAHRELIGGINILGWTAALAAYRDGIDWLDQVLAYLRANRDFLAEYVRKEWPQIRMSPVEGTYLAWLDCRSLGLGMKPYEFFLERAKVALNDGAAFGRGGEGFVRLNFACPRAILVEALGRMKSAMEAG